MGIRIDRPVRQIRQIRLANQTLAVAPFRAQAPGLLLLLWLLVASCILRAGAQTNFQTLLTNGPVANRLNVVVLAEGYTTNDLAAHFLLDATNALNELLSHQPYQEYRSYFNAFAISVSRSKRIRARPGESEPSPIESFDLLFPCRLPAEPDGCRWKRVRKSLLQRVFWQ